MPRHLKPESFNVQLAWPTLGKQIVKEIEQNQIEIEKKIGKQPKIFSYPYGESSKTVEEVIKMLNYDIAFSQTNTHSLKKLHLLFYY